MCIHTHRARRELKAWEAAVWEEASYYPPTPQWEEAWEVALAEG
jgi:hypothetical protein